MSSELISIILIEDNPMDARLLQAYLGESGSSEFNLTHVTTLARAQEEFSQRNFNLILCDLSLPDSQGLDTFRRVHEAAPNTPIIVLSGSDDLNLANEAVREGAQDYLVKGNIDSHHLSRAISYALERHQTDLALLESGHHYRRLLDSITDYAYRVFLKEGRPYTSQHGPGCIAVTGYQPEEFEQSPELWYKMVHREDRPSVLESISDILSGKTPPPLEHRIVHKNGEVCWVRHNLVPGKEENGTLLSYDGLISDITKRKKAEQKLADSEAFYHSLVENLPQNIFRKNLQEQFTFANQRFCNMLGKPLEEIIGKTDFDFYPEALASKYQQDDRRVIATGEVLDTVEENVSATGEKIYVQVVKNPIHDAKGQIIGTQCMFWDITERKRFEERLQKANQELAANEAALRQSNEDLRAAQMQLIQAAKMESIGTLAAGVAHEVKNPLAILTMGQNYLTKKLNQADEQIQTVLGEMGTAIERADAVTRQLLDFAASRQLNIQPENVNTVLKSALGMLRHGMGEKNITLVEQWGKNLPRVGVDRNQIQQVFVNLVMNAIDATPKGGTITLRTYVDKATAPPHQEGSRTSHRMWKGDTVVVTEVEDSGSGISKEDLVKIFDAFFTTKPTGIGTGMGLTVSRKIIELHGGDLQINNVSGSGVRAKMILKAREE